MCHKDSPIQFCPSVVSNFFQFHGLQHTRLSLSISNSRSLLKLMPIKSVMPSNHLILCCPLLLSPSIFPSIRVFSNESLLCIRQPKYWGYRCQGPSIQMQKVLRVWMQGNTEKCISEVQNKYCSLALV